MSDIVHPTYGKPLSGAPLTVDGVRFRPYQRGIGSYIRISDDFRLEVYCPLHARTYRAIVDGKGLAKNFRTQKNAMRAAVKAAKP